MSFKYDKRTVQHGNAKGSYSKISQNEKGELVLAPAAPYTGMRATSFETSQESTPYYADNVEHVRLQGRKTTSGSITAYQIPRQFMTDHLGKKLTNATPPALIDTGLNANFVFIYAETVTDEFGGEVEEYHIWTNVKASAPTAGTATDEESVEAKEIEIPCTASPNNFILDSEGKAVTEIIWTDDSERTVSKKYDALFGEKPGDVLEFIKEALGTDTETKPAGRAGTTGEQQ